MESIAAAPPSAKRKLEFLYDSESRRIRKRVYDWNGTAYVLSSNRRHLYDGWNLMAEIVASPTPFARTYVWGLDVSGSEQGAGGVGGLLAIQEAGESHYPVYDGNGTVMALVRGSDEGISGRYHYGAFGEVLEVEETGISNPFRFSTKLEDKETGLLYYGFRYYSPEAGRWLNRDPIGENGGVNLYGFVGNRPTGRVDAFGLYDPDDPNGPGGPGGHQPLPPVPGSGPADGFNPLGIRGDTGQENYTNFFDRRYPETMAKARKTVSESVDKRVKELCLDKSESPNLNGIAYGVNPDDFSGNGDFNQNVIERWVELGSFSIYPDNVSITWIYPGCSYSWEGTVYLEEQTGADPPWDYDGSVDALWFTGLFSKRHVRMAEWKIESKGKCPR